jgi:RNA polymerase sigma-70 factor (ECF subfamily)
MLSDDLRQRFHGGEPAAVETLFELYTPYIRAIVRRQLSHQLRTQFDSTDIIQSVWVQVVRQLGRDGWRVQGEDQWRALLATITRRRLIDRYRKHYRAASNKDSSITSWESLEEQHLDTPSQMIQADDLWEKMLRLCPSEYHPILQYRRQGLALSEIAEKIGLHEGSVRRILRRLARQIALSEEPLNEPPGEEREGFPA